MRLAILSYGLLAHVSRVEMADQVKSAQDARAYYLTPERRLYNPAKPNAFDTRLLSLFDSIEKNREDIDAKIEDLHDFWRHEGFWQRRRDEYKLNVVYRAVVAPMETWAPKTASIRQLEQVWRRVLRIVNGHRFSVQVIAKEWIGPPQAAPPSVAEHTRQES